MPTISIITPAYNCEKYLEEAVDSVLAQTLQDWEMLIMKYFSYTVRKALRLWSKSYSIKTKAIT